MAKAKLGSKRICQNCGTKYYDFDKDPVTCPSCNTVFDPEAFMRGRRSRAAVVLPAAEVRPEAVEIQPLTELTDAPVLEPVEGVDEPEPMDADQTDNAGESDVPDDLDLGPEFEDSDDTSAADDDSLLDDDELGEDDLPAVSGISDGGNDSEDS